MDNQDDDVDNQDDAADDAVSRLSRGQRTAEPQLDDAAGRRKRRRRRQETRTNDEDGHRGEDQPAIPHANSVGAVAGGRESGWRSASAGRAPTAVADPAIERWST